MLSYKFSPRSFHSFHNIMQRFYNEEEIFFSSSKRRSRTLICLVLLSVAAILLLITSVVFVTLYTLDHVTHSKSEKPKTICQSTARPYISTSQTTGGQLKYCTSKACLLTSKGRRKCVFPKLTRSYP